MERLTLAMTDRLIARGVVAEEEQPIIRYGLEVLLETVLSYASILIIALYIGTLLETVVFLGAFMLLRCYAGGYHASTRWRLFRNVLGSGWAETDISLSGDEAYLWLELNGRNTIIKVIDPATWSTVGSLTVPAPTSFTTNPSGVNITREVALAQFVREDNGDYLKDAHWNQVYYYRADGFNTLAKPQYLQSSVDGRYSYDSSMPKYFIGDTLSDKSKVHITPESNYSAEWVDIVLD